MNKEESGVPISAWPLWLAVIVCGCVIAGMTQSLAGAYTALRQMESRVSTLESKSAMIDALSTDESSPYRRYFDEMQELRRLKQEASRNGKGVTAESASQMEHRLGEAENRLSELDGRSSPGRFGFSSFGRGGGGRIGGVEDRLDDLEGDVQRLKKDVRSLDFDVNYGR